MMIIIIITKNDPLFAALQAVRLRTAHRMAPFPWQHSRTSAASSRRRLTPYKTVSSRGGSVPSPAPAPRSAPDSACSSAPRAGAGLHLAAARGEAPTVGRAGSRRTGVDSGAAEREAGPQRGLAPAREGAKIPKGRG